MIDLLTGIHFLLTYTCNFECDDCFLYCSPKSTGTFTIKQVRQVLDEAVKIGTIKSIYFEGGEAFLYYPIMLESIKLARERGFEVGIVTNAYWATSIEDAKIWLKPIKELGISDISMSDDSFHYGEEGENFSKNAIKAAKSLEMPVKVICIEKPAVKQQKERGEPVVGGGVMFRGRAVETLTENLPRRTWKELKECPYEELKDLSRVHVDSQGNVHVCQGISIGNMWKIPLSEIIENYDAESHPICGPLLRGGPAALCEEQGLHHEDGYVDECHFCYMMRITLIKKYPKLLCPKQVYGLE